MASLRELRNLGPKRGHAHWFLHWNTELQEKVIGHETALERARAWADRDHRCCVVCDRTGYVRFVQLPGREQPLYNTGQLEDQAWQNLNTK